MHKGFNFSQDGPGNRLVYHLRGCNLHCPWCSNPESMDTSDLSGAHTPQEILHEVTRSSKLFFDGGGVTFTGGEPTLRFDALRETLGLLHSADVNTAIETNGTHPELPELFGVTDFLIMDFKHSNSRKLRDMTGTGNETVISNLFQAAELRRQLLVRIPLINGFNASEEDARDFASVLCALDMPSLELEVLPYHEYGRDKWAACGKEYKMNNAFVTPEGVGAFKDIMRESGINVVKY